MSSLRYTKNRVRSASLWPIGLLFLLTLFTLRVSEADGLPWSTTIVNYLLTAVQSPQAVTITASKTDSLLVDVDSDTNADPGDTLRYTIVVANSGDTNALNTLFTDVTDDTEVTVVGGSLRATPIGTNDTY